MKTPSSVPYDAGAELVVNLVENPSAEAAVIDEILDAYSEGDREGALRLIGRIREARRIREAARTPLRSRRKSGAASARRRSSAEELVGA